MEFIDLEANSSSNPSDAPAEYFDVAPESRVVFPSRCIGTEPKPSTAKASRKAKGVYSHDPILDKNPNELWHFLVSNLRPPRLAVGLSGTHHKFIGRYNVIVTDFSMRIDISHRITQWSQLSAHAPTPSRKPFANRGPATPLEPTVREALEEYTSSRNVFKEFRMRKLVLWDYERVKQLLTDLVRSTGYEHSIHVSFPIDDHEVVAFAPNGCSRGAHSKAVWGVCCVSCLWIVFWPAWKLARKRIKDRLTCEYRSRQSADEFLERNRTMIRSAVIQRGSGESLVAL